MDVRSRPTIINGDGSLTYRFGFVTAAHCVAMSALTGRPILLTISEQPVDANNQTA